MPLRRNLRLGRGPRMADHGGDLTTKDLLVARKRLFAVAVEEKIGAQLHGRVQLRRDHLTKNVDINMSERCQSPSTFLSRRPCSCGTPAVANRDGLVSRNDYQLIPPAANFHAGEGE